MKKMIKASVMAVAMTAMAATAWAYPVAVGDTVTMYANDNSSIAYEGHYQADNLTDSFGVFGVFCLEQNEYFYPTNWGYNAIYKVESIVDYAKSGGLSGQDATGGDPLSYATKWIYSHFMQKDLESVVGLNNSTNLDAEIQDAIWKLEGEYNTVTLTGDALTIYTKANAASGSLAYDVKVMNLVYNSNFGSYKEGAYAQSQLIGQPVPEPSTLILLGAGIAALGFARRRSAKK
jgi:hypothetical protein